MVRCCKSARRHGGLEVSPFDDAEIAKSNNWEVVSFCEAGDENVCWFHIPMDELSIVQVKERIDKLNPDKDRSRRAAQSLLSNGGHTANE